MRLLIYTLLLAFTTHGFVQAQKTDALADSRKFQKKLNDDYFNRAKSPLDAADFEKFKGHDFFPITPAYIVKALLVVTENTPVFQMPTTTARMAEYRKYGEVVFTLHGQPFKLNIYQSPDLIDRAGYKDYLFLPFTDLTNGHQTYGGGRYIELRIPQTGNEITIDFNRAYNPFCAYNDQYSCPKVPAENHLEIPVEAGVKLGSK